MMDQWREWLYPLGFIASLAFGGRFLLQWIASEREQKSVVTRTFWQLSLIGNVLLLIHSFIQVQYHVCVIQACNAVISWRNLNLMRKEQVGFWTVIALFTLAIVTTTGAFMIQNMFWESHWFRTPTVSWLSTPQQVAPFWHAIGFTGLALFSSRFWVQWWYAEKHATSHLGKAFWWISLMGNTLTLLYFTRITDPVNAIGPTLGLIPYIRNLMLIEKHPPRVKAYE